MSFPCLLLIFAACAVVIAAAQTIRLLQRERVLREQKKNFRRIVPAHVAAEVLSASATITSAAWLAITCPVLALALAGGAAGYAFQRNL
jgi:hypothetical protein